MGTKKDATHFNDYRISHFNSCKVKKSSRAKSVEIVFLPNDSSPSGPIWQQLNGYLMMMTRCARTASLRSLRSAIYLFEWAEFIRVRYSALERLT